MKSRIAAPVLIALALLAGPTLGGCSLIPNPVEGIVEGVTGGDVELPGTEIPEGFPTDEVPLYEGEVVFGLAVGDGDAKAYSVSIRVPGPEAMDDIISQLESAGFESTVSGNSGEGATSIFTSDAWGVAVVIAQEDETNWLANYTVTTATS